MCWGCTVALNPKVQVGVPAIASGFPVKLGLHNSVAFEVPGKKVSAQDTQHMAHNTEHAKFNRPR